MNVAIIAAPRTRSSYFSDIIATNFNLDNKFETYQDIQQGSWDSRVYNAKYKQGYIKKISIITDFFLEQGNFVIKIFPSILIFPNLKNVVRNLKPFRLDCYDQIYFLTRKNIYEIILSQVAARHFSSFLYPTKYKVNILKYQTEIKLTDSVKNEINYVLASLELQKKLKEFLNNNNIQYIPLDYETIPDYVGKNFTEKNSQYQKVEINYIKDILNAQEIIDYIDSINPVIIKKLYNIVFK